MLKNHVLRLTQDFGPLVISALCDWYSDGGDLFKSLLDELPYEEVLLFIQDNSWQLLRDVRVKGGDPEQACTEFVHFWKSHSVGFVDPRTLSWAGSFLMPGIRVAVGQDPVK